MFSCACVWTCALFWVWSECWADCRFCFLYFLISGNQQRHFSAGFVCKCALNSGGKMLNHINPGSTFSSCLASCAKDLTGTGAKGVCVCVCGCECAVVREIRRKCLEACCSRSFETHTKITGLQISFHACLRSMRSHTQLCGSECVLFTVMISC